MAWVPSVSPQDAAEAGGACGHGGGRHRGRGTITARTYWHTGRFLVATDDAYVAADNTLIAPRVSGYISQVLVTDNQSVKAGQVLARIDDQDFQHCAASGDC